jgi:hypothetical protein
MPEFISKLQYKNYEKGEFSDEKSRSIEETLQLIKSFPWDEQRGVDIQLTSPSVTIQDEYVNYLKVGLYFNGKFSIYYLDSDNHLYEYHADNLDDVYKVVSDFFNLTLDLSPFEKHFFNIGNQKHFVNGDFTYQVELWRVILLSSFFIVFFVMFAVFAILFARTDAPFVVKSIFILLATLFASLLVYIFKRYFMCSDQALEISKGNSVFSLEDNNNNKRTYNKTDIKEIVMYAPGGGRNPNMFYVFEIYFKDGSVIKFSNMLISNITFQSKFSHDLIGLGKKNPLWML